MSLSVSGVGSHAAKESRFDAFVDWLIPDEAAAAAEAAMSTPAAAGCACDHGIRLIGDYDAEAGDAIPDQLDISEDYLLDDSPLDERPDITIDTIDADGVEDVIDECEIGTTRQSYSGPFETEGVGVCRPQIEECQATEEGARHQVIQEEITPQPANCNNGLDNNCDGAIDFYGEIGEDIRVTSLPSAPYAPLIPSLVWNGSEYGLSWSDYRNSYYEIYFARLDNNGNKIGDEIRITTCGGETEPYICPGGTRPVLAWTGSEYGVSWQDGRNWYEGYEEVYFARLDSLGNKIGDDLRITNTSTQSWLPSLIWNGSGYGISWVELTEGIYFIRLDRNGNIIGEAIRISDPHEELPFTVTSLSWTGSEYGLCWNLDNGEEGVEIYFARLNSLGNKIGDDSKISNNPCCLVEVPTLAWTGTEYGVAWEDLRHWGSGTNSEIYFARIDSTGNKIGEDIRITDAPNPSVSPSLVSTGSEYGLIWVDDRDGYGYGEIYFARLDSDANKMGEDLRITHNSTYASTGRFPSLVWTGSEYGVSWGDNRDGNNEIYFARIGCL